MAGRSLWSNQAPISRYPRQRRWEVESPHELAIRFARGLCLARRSACGLWPVARRLWPVARGLWTPSRPRLEGQGAQVGVGGLAPGRGEADGRLTRDAAAHDAAKHQDGQAQRNVRLLHRNNCNSDDTADRRLRDGRML